jgi:TQXA domain-containing protein
MLGVSTALMIGVLPAAAGTSPSGHHPSDDTSTATVVGDDGDGTSVTMDKSQAEGGGSVHTLGVLNKVQIVRNGVPDPKTVDAYCIDITTGLDTHTTMTGGQWSDFIGRTGSTFHQNNQKINWILQNSYPSMDLATLSQSAKLPDTISAKDAISGTQAAIWYFSDGANLETQKQGADLVALYNYLISPANTGVAEGTIGITPDKATGTVGKLVGPFTVSTNLTGLGFDVHNLPSGVTVVDANGTPLAKSALVNGAKFYLNVPAGTTATSGSLSVFGNTPSGEIFTAPQSQEVIAAGKTTVQAVATATWTQGAATTPPTTPTAGGTTSKTGQQPGLAYTGVSSTGPIVLGILLLAAGGLFLLVQRRLKRAA